MPEKAVEQQLAEMEFALRKDDAPDLYQNHDIGFTILESDDDEQRAVGIRVFMLGKELLYAPIFFYKGDLRGSELLYLKREDLFIPFEERWTNYIRSKEPFLLGEGSAEEFNPTEPDFSTIVETPPVGRPSVGTVDKLASAKKASQALNEGLMDSDLSQIIKEADEDAKLGLMHGILENPGVGAALANRVPNLLQLLKPEEKSASENVEPSPPLDVIDIVEDESETLELGEKANRSKANSPRTSGTQLLNDLPKRFVVPSDTGLYKMLRKEADPFKALVIGSDRPVAPFTYRSDQLTIVNLDNGTYDRKSPKSICAEQTPLEWSKMYDDLPSRRTLKRGKYVFIGPRQDQVLGPIRIESVTRLSNGQVKVSTGYNGQDLYITKSTGRPVVLEDQNRVMLPKTWKALPIEQKMFEPISADEVVLAEGLPLQLKEAEVGCFLEVGEKRFHARNHKEATLHLQEEYGLDERTSNKVLHDFRRLGRDFFLIKESGMTPPTQIAGIEPGTPVPLAPSAVPPGGSAAGPGLAPEAQKALEAALQAQEVGQGDVLDVSALSAMLSSSSSTKFIRKYASDLLTAVDRCGRILYVMYWEWEDFTSELGAKDLEELEDHLMTAFRAIGESFLDIKDKLSGPEEIPIFE